MTPAAVVHGATVLPVLQWGLAGVGNEFYLIATSRTVACAAAKQVKQVRKHEVNMPKPGWIEGLNKGGKRRYTTRRTPNFIPYARLRVPQGWVLGHDGLGEYDNADHRAPRCQGRQRHKR